MKQSIKKILRVKLNEAKRRKNYKRPAKQWTTDDSSGKKATVTNRKMCDDTYTLRKKVMNYVYRARNLIRNTDFDFPRVTVRIVDITLEDAEKSNTLGFGSMDDTVTIWIPANAICDRINLQQLIYHELGHAVFKIGHINDPLMKQGQNSLNNSPEELDKMFLNLINYKK